MSGIQNLKERVAKLERQSGVDKINVLRAVYYEGTDNAKNLKVLTPEEEAILQKYEEEMIAAAKPGKWPVVVYFTKQKAQELLAQAEKSDAQAPAATA